MNKYFELKSKLKDLFLNAKSEKDMRFYLLCILALETGARVSDLLKLEWDNFDLVNNTVTYLNKKSKKTQEQLISSTLVNYINRYKNVLEVSKTLHNSVFYNNAKNSILSRVTANRRTQKEFNINFHELRKEAGKNVASQQGVVMASKYLGHSRVSTTDIYLGISNDTYKKQMKFINL
jgi:integrase